MTATTTAWPGQGAVPDRGTRRACTRSGTRSWRPGGAPGARMSPPTASTCRYVRDPDLDTPLTRSAEPVLREPAREPGRPADQRHPHRPGRGGAHPADRRPRPRAAPRRGQAGPGLQLRRGVRRHQRHRHRAGGRQAHRTCSAMSTTPSTWRTWPAPGCRSGIRSPARRIGAVDLTCWRKDADPLLIALAKTTADQITQALLADSGAPEYELLRGVPAGVPPHHRDRAGAQQRHRHDERLRPAGAGSRRPGRCCSGTPARRWPPTSPARSRSSCPPAYRRGCTAGRSRAPASRAARSRPCADDGAAQPARPPSPGPRRGCILPGLVGSGALWLRGCQQVEAAYDVRRVAGAGGRAGRRQAGPAARDAPRRNPAGHFHVLDAADASRPRLAAQGAHRAGRRTGSVVIRHVDRLSARRLHACPAALEQARSRPAGTARSGSR